MAHKMKKLKIVVALWTINLSGREILSGIFNYAKTRIGWDIQLVHLPNAIHPEKIADMAAGGVDGIITSDLSDATLRKILMKHSMPAVYISPPNVNIPRPPGSKTSCVNCDDIAIGAMGAKHFLSLGNFNSFGFLYSEDIPNFPNLREQGFRETLARACKKCHTFKSPIAPDERINADDLAFWIKSLPKPAAIMTFYVPQAVQTAKVCREHTISIPGQISILGVDDDGLLCEFTKPTLSSIRPDHERVGFLAAMELNALMTRSSHRPRTLAIPPLRVVERESTKPLTPAAHLIRKAQKFIYEHAAKGIGVADVVKHLKISRRLADLRFREIENTSIRQMIEDRRMELAEKALSESTHTIASVAAECGYRSVKTFESAFRKRHNTSPGTFRTKSSM
jgi:LacI family transcriptional regulator